MPPRSIPGHRRRSSLTGWPLALLSLALVSLAAMSATTLFVHSTLRAQSDSDPSDAILQATAGERFSFTQYELTHLPNRWLETAASWFGQQPMSEAEAYDRWFGRGDVAARQSAEWHLERRISAAAASLDLSTALPLFNDARLIWPPVDIDMSEPLAVLAISRRDEVRLVGTVLLKENRPSTLSAEMERVIEASGEWSAWVTTVGGVALYPAQVVAGRSFETILQIIAHEWVHHYLAFHPLGLAYGRDADMRTINETIADIAGDEIAESAAAAISSTGWRPPANADAAQRRAEIRAATDPILRQLRLDVDALLADGRIAEAETIMEDVRSELVDLGRPLRRLNQAALAFRGSYGASPSSASEWGDRLFAHRAQSDSLATFLASVRAIGSRDEAEALLPR